MNASSLLNFLKRYPLAILCSLLFVVLLVFSFMRADGVVVLSEKEAELGKRISLIESNIRSGTDLAGQVEALEAFVENLDRRLFVREERAINTNFFYSLENRLDVVFTEVSQQPTEETTLSKGGVNALSLHSTIVYDVGVRGLFPDILRFIDTLHSVEPRIRVSGVEVSGGGGRGGQTIRAGVLTARLRVIVLAKKT